MAWLAVFAMGLVLGSVGGGGGILTVPILVGLFGLSATESTGGSLLVVGLSGLIGSIRGFWRDEIDSRAAVTLAIPSSLGAFAARRWILPAIPATVAGVDRDRLLLGGFAVLMVIVAIRMAMPRPEAEPRVRNLGWVALSGALLGIVSGTFGAGGGFLILPALILLLGTETKRAISTSLTVIAIQSLFGFMGEVGKEIRWSILVPVSLVAIMGLAVGLVLRDRLSGRVLQWAFSAVVLAVACWMAIQVF